MKHASDNRCMKLLHVHALLNRKHELTLAGPTKLVLTLLGNLRFGQTWYNRCLVSIARRDMHFLRKFSQFVNFERHGRDRRGPPPPPGVWLDRETWITYAGGTNILCVYFRENYGGCIWILLIFFPLFQSYNFSCRPCGFATSIKLSCHQNSWIEKLMK